jgi:hypothetical protein
MSPSEYFAYIELVLHSVNTHVAITTATPIIIWANSPAWPRHDHDGSWTQQDADTRTNIRLKQMNDYTMRRFKEEGYLVMDSFSLTEAFVDGHATFDG